jgi:putative transposase
LVRAAGAENRWIACGIPDCAILDNGMEFHAHIFKLIAWDLAIDLEYCRIRTPWLKPKVERFFATLDYLTLLEGRIYKPMANVLRIDPKKDAAITLSELCKGLVIYIVGHQTAGHWSCHSIDLQRALKRTRRPVFLCQHQVWT